MTRRDAVATTVIASLGAAVAPAAAAPPPPSPATAGDAQDPLTEREITSVLRDIRDELRAWHRDAVSCRMPSCSGIAWIRRNQRQFLKSTQKFPDFMEVGANVWDDVVDWHVRTLRQAQITQRPDGRYTIPFLQTTLVLRLDYDDDQVGLGYDQRAGA